MSLPFFFAVMYQQFGRQSYLMSFISKSRLGEMNDSGYLEACSYLTFLGTTKTKEKFTIEPELHVS
jgi:hypothetical protein